MKINQFHNFRNFSDLMTENGFKMLFEGLTHCSSRSGHPISCIDHIWQNFDVDLDYKSGIIDYLIADHLPMFISFKTKFVNPIIKKSFHNFLKENFHKFNECKQDIFYSDIIDYDIIIAMNNFNKWIANVLKSFKVNKKIINAVD